MISVRVPQDVYNKLDWVSDQNYTDISTTVRQGIREVFSKNEDILTDEYIAQNGHHSRHNF